MGARVSEQNGLVTAHPRLTDGTPNMFSLSTPQIAAEAVIAARTYLRIEQADEDALLERMLGAALRHVEAFTGQLLLRRAGVDRLPVSGAWQRLGVTPVHAVTAVSAVSEDGTASLLDPHAYALDIDGSGDGWLRLTAPPGAARVDVTVDAGLASDWAALPEPLRLAVLRLAGHLYGNRDGADDAGPPAAVAALLRPWRRMRLT